MKVLFNLVIVALAVVAGWYAQPGLVKALDIRKENRKKQREAEIAAAVRQAGGKPPAGAPGAPAPLSAAGQLAEAMRKSTPPPLPSALPQGSASGSMPGKDTGTSSTADDPSAGKDPIEAKYPLPAFREITEITKEWSSIPSRAFPRTVKTKVAVTLDGPDGKVTLPENSEALAVGMTQGMLVLMKSRKETARSLVPLANTDLKDTLTSLYEKYKSYKVEQVMKQRERARSLKDRANGATEAEMAAAGPKPRAGPDGVITAMLNSLRAKEITETSEDKITAWGDINLEKFDGRDYWTGTLQCTVDNALFGPIPTELIALIRDDKVVKWLYSGSKEEVQ